MHLDISFYFFHADSPFTLSSYKRLFILENITENIRNECFNSLHIKSDAF